MRFSHLGNALLVPHLGGTAPILPYTLDFTGLSAFPAGWTAPNWTVSANTAKNTPTEGSNLITNPEFTTNTTGWTAVNTGVLTRRDYTSSPDIDPTGGADNFGLEVASGGNNGSAGQTTPASTVGQWYRGSVRAYAPSANSGTNVASLQMNGRITSVSAENAWQTLAITERATGAGVDIRARCLSAFVGDLAHFDLAKCGLLSNLIAYRDFSENDVIVKAAWTIGAMFQAGVIALSDGTLNNCLKAGYNRPAGTAVLLQYVGGSVTQLISTSVAYSAGADVEIRISSNGGAAELYYNNGKIGATQAPHASLQAFTQAGLFSTDVSNTCTSFSVVAN